MTQTSPMKRSRDEVDSASDDPQSTPASADATATAGISEAVSKAPAAGTAAGSSDADAASTSAAPEPSQLLYVNLWYYDDMNGIQQGPFSSIEMKSWVTAGYMPPTTKVAPSYYGEVPVTTWPIETIWKDPKSEAFVLAEDAQVLAAEPSKPEFIPSDFFDGCREGYAFKTRDDYGTGYYRDDAQPVEITCAATAMPLDCWAQGRRARSYPRPTLVPMTSAQIQRSLRGDSAEEGQVQRLCVLHTATQFTDTQIVRTLGCGFAAGGGSFAPSDHKTRMARRTERLPRFDLGENGWEHK